MDDVCRTTFDVKQTPVPEEVLARPGFDTGYPHPQAYHVHAYTYTAMPTSSSGQTYAYAYTNWHTHIDMKRYTKERRRRRKIYTCSSRLGQMDHRHSGNGRNSQQ
jgi:hypothetical protein